MDKNNKKTAGAVVIVLIIVLLFSWQYMGQEEKGSSSPMEGEWLVADMIQMQTATENITGYSTDFAPAEIHVEGDILTMTSDGTSLNFAMVSDTEAVSMDFSGKWQLYLHDGVLYSVTTNQVITEEASGVVSVIVVMTRDGSLPADFSLPDMQDDAYTVIASLYNEGNTFLEEAAVSFYVDDQNAVGLEMSISAWDVEDKALGFLKTDGNGMVTVFCITTSGAVYNMVIDDGEVVALTGIDSSYSPRYYVFDGQGILSEDTYGLGDDTMICTTEGLAYTVDAFYEDGRLCVKTEEGNLIFGVQALGIDGAFAMMTGFCTIVDIDGSLWMLDPTVSA